MTPRSPTTAAQAPTLEAACRRWPARPATTHAGVTTSYAELWERVSALAGAYRWLGVGPGDRILCQLPTSPEFLVAVHAAWACGAVHVGADNDLTGTELSRLVERTEASVLLFQHLPGAADPLAPLRPVTQAHPGTTVVVHGARPQDERHLSLEDLLGTRAGPMAAAKAEPPEPPERAPDDPALLFLTSGTTGTPKGVVETMAALWAKVAYFADAFGPGPDDVHLMYLPISHAFGLKLSLTALLSGGRLVLLDRFSPSEALRLVTEERVSVLPGTPTHLTLLVKALDSARHDVASLRWAVAAAAPLPPPLLDQVYAKLGVELFYVYGCSEGFLVSTTERDEIYAGSVGTSVFRGPPGTPPDGSVAVVEPYDHTPLPPGEVGEIVFGARQPVRYWGEAEVATEGWYHTGDLGRIDDDGLVHVVGRLKELINRGGLKVAPGEVEAALVRHPGVADAGVIATPDPVLGEAVCACVVPAGHPPPDLAELRAFLGADLGRHKLPDELCLLEAIPRTKIAKVDRAALRGLVVDADAPRQFWRAR